MGCDGVLRKETHDKADFSTHRCSVLCDLGGSATPGSNTSATVFDSNTHCPHDGSGDGSNANGARTSAQHSSRSSQFTNDAADEYDRPADADYHESSRRGNAEHATNANHSQHAANNSCTWKPGQCSTSDSSSDASSWQRTLRARTRNNAAERLCREHISEQSGSKSHHATEFGYQSLGLHYAADLSGKYPTAKRSAESNRSVSGRSGNQRRHLTTVTNAKNIFPIKRGFSGIRVLFRLIRCADAAGPLSGRKALSRRLRSKTRKSRHSEIYNLKAEISVLTPAAVASCSAWPRSPK